MNPDAIAIGGPEEGAILVEDASELPSGWVQALLGELLPLEYGKALPDRLRDATGKVAVYGSSGLVGRHTTAIVAGPTLIVGRKGSAGAVFYCGEDCWPIDTVYFTKPNPVIDLRYGFYFLKWKQLGRLDQSTAIPSLSRDIYSDVAIPLAPLPEQRRIVARIDELFADIAEGETALERARQGLDTWRRALLKAAVTGELTRDWREANRPAETGADLLARIRAEREESTASFSRRRRAISAGPLDTSVLPELPEGWVWARLHELGEVSGGLTKNPDREDFPHKLPYLRVANVQMGRVDLTEVIQIGVRPEERNRLLLGQNDLLVVEGNGSIDQIGRCALWNDEIRPCVHQNHIIKVRFPEPALSSWTLRWLLSPSGREAIKAVASSTSGLHTLSISKIQNLPIPVPSLQEACVALRVLEDSLAAASEAEDDREKLMRDRIALRQSILKAAFEGQLVEQDPRDEPASELLVRLRKNYLSNGARRRRARAAVDVSHPSLPGLTRQSVDPRVEPAGDE